MVKGAVQQGQSDGKDDKLNGCAACVVDATVGVTGAEKSNDASEHLCPFAAEFMLRRDKFSPSALRRTKQAARPWTKAAAPHTGTRGRGRVAAFVIAGGLAPLGSPDAPSHKPDRRAGVASSNGGRPLRAGAEVSCFPDPCRFEAGWVTAPNDS